MEAVEEGGFGERMASMTVVTVMVVGTVVGGGADLRVESYERRGGEGQDMEGPMF